MLGSGRPFVVQLENCRSTKALRAGTLATTLEQLAKCINAGGDVEVKCLKRITKQQVGPISVGQEGMWG
jgi:tRNA U54 and U55 pseudouridine synthase Pus10